MKMFFDGPQKYVHTKPFQMKSEREIKGGRHVFFDHCAKYRKLLELCCYMQAIQRVYSQRTLVQT
jgi:hypothetical protein